MPASDIILLLSTIFIGLIVQYYVIIFLRRKPGLKGPFPWPFIGNLYQLKTRKRGELELEWAKKYGKAYVMYIFYSPRIVLADLDMIIDVGVKNGSKFVSIDLPFLILDYHKESFLLIKPEDYKDARAVMSPSMTSNQLKKKSKLFDQSSDSMMKSIFEDYSNLTLKDDKKKPVEIDLSHYIYMYTMDVTSSYFFGIQIDQKAELKIYKGLTSNVNNSANKGKRGKSYVELQIEAAEFPAWTETLPLLLPEKLLLYLSFFKRQRSAYEGIEARLKALFDKRRSKLDQYDDLLSQWQSLLENKTQNNPQEAKNSINLRRDNISMKSIVGDLILLTIGSESSQLVLSEIIYALAFHQDYQEQIYEEFKSIVQYDENGLIQFNLSHETDDKLKLTRAFIKESMRMLSTLFVTRVCDIEHEMDLKGYKINFKKGDIVHFSIINVHYDDKNWSEPFKFDPTRFMAGKKDLIVPNSLIPFGLGHRKCIGYRFGLQETKIAVGKMLMKYKIVPAKGHSFPPTESHSSFLTIHESLNVSIIAREYL